jgi:hypothetical protein
VEPIYERRHGVGCTQGPRAAVAVRKSCHESGVDRPGKYEQRHEQHAEQRSLVRRLALLGWPDSGALSVHSGGRKLTVASSQFHLMLAR